MTRTPKLTPFEVQDRLELASLIFRTIEQQTEAILANWDKLTPEQQAEVMRLWKQQIERYEEISGRCPN